MINIILTVTNDIVADNRVHKIASTLCHNGYQVTIVGCKSSNSENLFSRVYKTRRFRLWFNKTFLFYANYNVRLFLYLMKVPVDIIVSNDLDTLLACWLTSKLRKKTLVFDSHELFTELPELVDRPFVKKFWHLKERLLLPGIKLGYTVSKPIQNYFKEKYNKDFQLIRNVGMFKHDVEFKSIEDEFVIIYQGAVNVGRGLELMLQALQHIEKGRLWVLGSGELLQELTRLSKELKVEDKVIFFGRVELEELAKYTRKAHIGISLEEDLGLNYRYALPNKIFDYIQARVPVIVSDLPVMKSVINDYGIGIVLEDRTPQNLADIVHKFVNDKEKQRQVQQNLELAARDLCWQREEEKVIMLYRKAFEFSQDQNA